MLLRKSLALLCLALSSTSLISASGPHPSLAPADKIIGRWDVTIHEANGGQYPSWFEVTREAGKLTGRFVGRVGSQRPIKTIEFANGHLTFSLPIQYERHKSDLKFEANLVGARLEGTTLDPNGGTLKWTAVRAPKLDRKSAPKWGKPISLFNGSDLAGWKVRDARKADSWRVVDALMENTPRGTDLITEANFTDFKLHVEFKMVEKGNSGVYLRGRYEVQIEDNFGQEPESHRIGGVYGFLTPSNNPAKKAGEWQSFDITLIGRTVTVLLNDKMIIDKAEIPGITGGALDGNEGEPGPIMLQGDHEKIYYRKIVITPAK
jgi:3-keto-disaccharide hydrolase